MAKCIMVQGTMSGAGKSLLVTALCRIFRQDGLRTAPFKSQNMALNSYITEDGLEMGRAQAVQAMAAGRCCDVRMNPILLKPSSDTGSQLIVDGKPRGHYHAREYFQMKKSLIPVILKAYNSLAAENDVIVIEGAGSPAEINLREDDIVNMGLANLVDAPVLLAGDIDRGGVFAQLYGTVALLQPEEKARVAGLVINKFRGDAGILKPGLKQLEELTGIPVLGVVPYMQADIDDEDSISERLWRKRHDKVVDIAVVRLPRISNFTDFIPLEQHPALGVRYVSGPDELGHPDLVILPGTKSTMADLRFLRESGLEAAILHLNSSGTPVLGICGGYQMLGEVIRDPAGVESGGAQMAGIGLLPCETFFAPEKTRTRVTTKIAAAPFSGTGAEGYEIHLGETARNGGEAFSILSDGREDGAAVPGDDRRGSVFGTYLHGLFDTGEMTRCLADWLLERKGLSPDRVKIESHAEYQERQFDLIAEAVRGALDMEAVYKALR